MLFIMSQNSSVNKVIATGWIAILQFLAEAGFFFSPPHPDQFWR
jgi:hypothetical protein